ncbi:MAG: DMT family transporter [Patescibacteria group bacterium]
MTHSRTYGSSLVLISALIFGSYGVWSRLIGSAMGNFYQGWTRAFLILLVLVPIAYLRKEIVRIHPKDRFWMALFLLFTSLTQAPLFYAFNHMDIGTAQLLFYVSMLLTMNVIGVCTFDERMTKLKIISSLLAFIGMYLVFSFSLEAFTLFAALMAIVNGVASGGEVAFSKKLTGNYSPLYVVLLSWAIILPTNAVLSLGFGEIQIAPSLSIPWFWQLCYSAVSLAGFWLVIEGVKYIDASIAALIGLMEVLFGILFGVVVFGERITPLIIIGGICIISAASLAPIASLVKNKRKTIFLPE